MTMRMTDKIKFISYEGKYPNLCGGVSQRHRVHVTRVISRNYVIYQEKMGGWGVNWGCLLEFQPRNMPWNIKLSLAEFIKVGDILHDCCGDRFLIQSRTEGGIQIKYLKTGEVYRVLLSANSLLKGAKVLITCDAREIPEHLKVR